ncbi:MAG: hypothetical protein IJM59_09555 [Proteobacteria bacterium]|nr:hypothetical protein [Pseudomonadota bacterium]
MSHYEAHLGHARDFYAEGNYEAAKAAAEYALSCAHSNEGSEARVIQAFALRKLEYNDEALELLRNIIQTEPTPEACAEYALMCAERGHCDTTCRELATRAIAEDPDIASGYIALFWCDSTDGQYIDALRNLRRGMHRGAEFSDARAFEMVRSWCQECCDENRCQDALELSSEVVDLFATFDFIILHARLAELNGEHRLAVTYYKQALMRLRPGNLRTDILEAIARIAI